MDRALAAWAMGKVEALSAHEASLDASRRAVLEDSKSRSNHACVARRKLHLSRCRGAAGLRSRRAGGVHGPRVG